MISGWRYLWHGDCVYREEEEEGIMVRLLRAQTNSYSFWAEDACLSINHTSVLGNTRSSTKEALT